MPPSLLCGLWILLFWSVEPNLADTDDGDVYSIGVGIADITGPSAGVNMMGYANPSQTTGGIHTRLYSRAFIIGDVNSRIVYISADIGMGTQMVKHDVVSRLKDKYGGLYTEANVCISGTHTHSGPGGYMEYVIYLITSMGFVKQSFEALVEGIVKSIDRAHKNIKPGYIYYNEGELLGASINRSPTSYLNNPQAERDRYPHDTDKSMFLLKFVDTKGKPIGMINWFAVHCTSMNYSNHLVSSDNKGYASLLFEQMMNPGKLPGRVNFVAAFSQSNEGDVSPNIFGAHCQFSGKPCDSTCEGQNEMCVATGPGKDQFESTKIIGEKQFEKAKELFNSAKKKLKGPIQFHQYFVDMSNTVIDVKGQKITTCKPAMGHSFAAGTTDGPGSFSFRQGLKHGEGSPFWNLVRNFIKRPSMEQEQCHFPKPILFSTGEMHYPYEWQPSIIDVQLLRIGNLLISAIPGEITTMGGRRLREEVQKIFSSSSPPDDPHVVIAGLANTYVGYIVTFEEYQLQRYEGASCIFGPHSLNAFIHHFKNLTNRMLQNEPISTDVQPPDLKKQQISLLPGVLMDSSPVNYDFGSCLEDVKSSYDPGTTVKVSFVCGHPRNNLMLDSTYLTVEILYRNKWMIVATDGNWETQFHWERTSTLLGQSSCTITWDIPLDALAGIYRIRHFGFRRSFFGTVSGYEGISSRFTVNGRENSSGGASSSARLIKNRTKRI